MDEQQRADLAESLGNDILALIAARCAANGADGGDILAIGLCATAGIAVAIAATKAVDAAAAVALVRLTAEAAAKDIYG